MRLIVTAIVSLTWAAGLSAQQTNAVAQSGGDIWTVDAANSAVHWLVYKAGALARLGHNHVISVGTLTGTVTLDDDLSASRFELEIPVADLVVDDPTLRAAQGEEFSSEPSADDIAGTRRNMLSEGVLNGDDFPLLRISGTGPNGAAGEQTLDVTVELLGREVPLTLPTSVEIDGDTLTASGDFTLTHEMLGMEPFSVMMGALQVGEQLDFTYRIMAHPAD